MRERGLLVAGFGHTFAVQSVKDVLEQPVKHVLELDTEACPTRTTKMFIEFRVLLLVALVAGSLPLTVRRARS